MIVPALVAIAVFVDAEPAPAPSCAPGATLAWQDARELDAQQRHGFWLGMSEREFRGQMKSKRDVQAFRDRERLPRGMSQWLVSELPDGGSEKVYGTSQVLVFQRGKLASIAESVEDAKTSGVALSRAQAHGVLADYVPYLCWRFGQVTPTSGMGARTRGYFLGPVQVLEQVAAGDEQIAVDVFVVEKPGDKSETQVMIVTRAARFGSE